MFFMSPHFLPVLAAFALTQTLSFGQGVIGGNQNGLGVGGYLPKPPTVEQPARNRLVASLTTPGYEFDIIKFGSGSVQVVVDPAGPIAVPLAAHAGVHFISPEPIVPLAPGFWATFSIANNTASDRDFTFPWQYWADNKILFRVYDGNDTLIWQSVQIPVDQPPLAQPATLTLHSKTSWRVNTFVPLNPGGTVLVDGQYRLEATISGTPVFSANAGFEVKNLVGGPIVAALSSGIKGVAQVGPVTPVSLLGVPNVKPLSGAIIKAVEIRRMGVFYINPPFTAQAVADDRGNFSLDAPAGSYAVTGLPPIPGAIFPRGSTQTVQVTDGNYTQIVVDFDSGIR